VLEQVLRPPGPIDLGLTLGPFSRGGSDPTMRIEAGRVVRATRTPDGPATGEFVASGDDVVVRAWGPGARHVVETAPALLGFDDDPGAFVPRDPMVAELHRRTPGLRLGRSGAVTEALVPTILEQKVYGSEARRSYRLLVRRFGEPAPGPISLMLPPAPDRLASLPYYAFHPCEIERRRADTIRRACRYAPRLEATAPADASRLSAALSAIPGIGPWTCAEVAALALGDPDAVSVGDYNLPRMVAYAFAGEREADDARMLELLEPFRPHRLRVVRLLSIAGSSPPRRAPRAPRRRFIG